MAEKGSGKMKIKNIFSSLKAGAAKKADSKRGNLALIFIVIILINIVGSFLFFRLDLSLNDSYSLSKVSRDLVKSLQEPLIVKVFFSDNLPAPYNTSQRYLNDLLTEYESAGGSNVRVENVDVSSEEGKKTAASFGILPRQVSEYSNDQGSVRAAYMGFVLISGDLIEKFGEVSTTSGLEYKITSALRKMSLKSSALLDPKASVKVTFYFSNSMRSLPIQGIAQIDQIIQSIFEKVNKRNFNKLSFTMIDPNEGNMVKEISEKFNLPKYTWPSSPKPAGGVIPAGEGLMSVVVENGKNFQVLRIDVAQSYMGNTITGIQNFDEKLNNAVGAVLASNTPVAYAVGHGEREMVDSQESQENKEGATNLKKVLSELYDVKEVDLTKEEIGEEYRTLIINGPKAPFNDEELYKIDQFIMRGGNVAFYIDSFDELKTQSPYPMPSNYVPIETGLDRLLSPLGVSVNKDVVLDKKCFIRRGQGSDIAYYHAPQIEKSSLNNKNVISKYLNSLTYLMASTITVDDKIVKQTGLKPLVLIKTSKEAWKMQGRIEITPSAMMPPSEDKLSQYNLAVLIEGKFKSIFNGVKPAAVIDPKKKAPEKKQAAAEAQPLKESSNNGKIFVTATSYINGFDPEGKQPNAVYFMNIVDYLNGNTTIQAMRSKDIMECPIDATKPLTRLIIKWLNIVGVPLIGIGAGLFMWRRRSARKKNIQKLFSNGGSK